MRSTTSNKLCGDYSLSFGSKLRYFINCLKDNLGGTRNHAILAQTPNSSFTMKLSPLEALKNELCWTASPSRLYSEAFWRSLPWRKIGSILKNVTILELGCGSGSKFKLFAKLLEESLVRYIGVDKHPCNNWDDLESLDPRVSFLEANMEDLPKDLLASVNLIVSQSVLEHAENDLLFFLSHRASISLQRPLIQIHLVPAEVSLFLYFCHGYRQYSRRSISRIATIYPELRCYLICLGGMLSNLLHFFAISLPGVLHVLSLRQLHSDWYTALLQICYSRERLLNCRYPSFYGIILETAYV